ncbi:MAG: arginine--tRNA ligase, partial [Treponema sp.]|nr:arginine--tRNA ligase [Treponema sp.]
MQDYKEIWKKAIAEALRALAEAEGSEAGASIEVKAEQLFAETPPDPKMGDIGFPMFAFAKAFKKGPPDVARLVCEKLAAKGGMPGTALQVGPYVNVKLDRAAAAKSALAQILADEEGDFAFARPGTMAGQKIIVEFSSPNTNKPLHLGHLRNDALGESVSRILAACGADLRKLCIINDRGIHICKSMLAYKDHGQGKTPESEGVKSDHFVGEWYVKFSQELKAETEALVKSGVKKEEAEARAPLMASAQEMLRKWEAGDAETVDLWKKMNSWAIEGMKETYARTGITFDKFDFESDVWLLGKAEVLKGLDKGIFYKREDGAIAVDLEEEKLDKKVLLRGDGTAIYITQDFGLAINRHGEWPFDKMIYVVGSEQQYHFKVLFVI